VGLHATDPATPYLSRWARLPGVTVADLDAEPYQRRSLVKHLAMRRTLWMVRTEDLPLIHEMAEYAGGHHDRTTRTVSVCSGNQGAADGGAARPVAGKPVGPRSSYLPHTHDATTHRRIGRL
jgi:hypothetical protein